MSSNKEKADQLRLQGNECVKAGNYNEAVIHYTHAIQIDSKNHFLYSNRSLVFLKVEQYYFAYEDAKTAIKLQPSWPKGFFRKGEVEFQVGNYTAAVLSYGQALLLDPTNQEVRDACTRTNKELAKLRKIAARQPWIFIGGGLLVGLVLVLADQFLTKRPSIEYLVLQILMILVFGGIGYGCLKIYRYMNDTRKTSLLEPPIDLLEEMNGVKKAESENRESDSNKPPEHRTHRKGGVSAARQRYKKGKS